MRQASRLLPWLALACVLGVACAKAEPAVVDIAGSSSSSRELLQAPGSYQPSKPNCVCPMHYQPVCCHDGKTYGNACTARCKGATVLHKGECKPNGSVKMETMSTDSSSSGSASGNSSSVSADTTAVKKGPCFCAKMYAPVCSKDQKTYGNACEAKCAGVEVDHTGPCLDSSSASTVTSTTDVPAPSSESAACQCDATVKADVCGEDGKTYTNECFADCAGAKVVTKGACKPKPKCKAPCWWPYKPVCGKDGKTYANECRAACKGVDIVSQGACRVRGRNGGWFGRKPACVCTANYDPVCGKNNKTYSNSCEANCEDVAVSHKGVCEEPVDAKTSSNSTASKDGKPISVGSCVCPMVWKPVCTKNGKTRGNKCEAKCRGETVEKEGECDSKVATQDDKVKSTASLAVESAEELKRLPSQGAAIPMKPPRKPDCVCIQLWAPVCGTDGNTYSNKCEAKCHDMAVAREGECDTTSTVDGATLSTGGVYPGCNVCPAVFLPVCGKDGKTYGNECEAACRGKTKVAYEGRCKGDKAGEPTGISGLDRCLEGCGKSNKPVCGVDRKRYKSACAAHCYKVDIAYPGDCNPECSACPHTWFPYCANSAQYGPATYANCCFAKCNNVPIIKSVLHAGVCLDKCGKCDPTLERPLCCKGRTYKNGCYALCNEEDTSQCSKGRCSSTAHVDEGLACLMGPCPLQCSGAKYDQPVCGSDGNTYPSQCSLMCSQKVAIVHKGKCGTCAPNQLPGGFPFCAANDRVGVSPVCGKDGVTYRNSIAAGAASVEVASTGTCSGSTCGLENEVCFVTRGEQSSCCAGYTCTADTSVKVEQSLAEKVMGGVPGVCKKTSATLSA